MEYNSVRIVAGEGFKEEMIGTVSRKLSGLNVLGSVLSDLTFTLAHPRHFNARLVPPLEDQNQRLSAAQIIMDNLPEGVAFEVTVRNPHRDP